MIITVSTPILMQSFDESELEAVYPYVPDTLILTLGQERNPPWYLFCGDDWNEDIAQEACRALHQG